MLKTALFCFSIVVLFHSLSLAEPPWEMNLMDQEVTVPRGDFKEVHFLVPPDKPNLEFQGNFKCMGGFNDDVTFLAMTQADYVRWFSHYDYQADVKLKKKTDGTFRFKAKPGVTYYFVFDNFFSSVSNKKVKFQLNFVPASK